MIVVLFDVNDNLTDFYNLSRIRIYKKEDQEFKVIREISDISMDTSNIKSSRESLSKLIEEFGTSKIIVGSQITGIPYHFFAKEGFEIFEAQKFSEELLAQIHEDYIENPKNNLDSDENDLEKIEIANTPIAPFATNEEGDYFLDFTRVQKYRPEITSKKALLPFLSNELYQSLIIVCNHVMPWLENYFAENKNIQFSSKRENGIYTIIIVHKGCSD
ncbi:Iron only nitrogenase protein AnfO (AnfO_nitrog) [[Clostridium] fimetarium]|uniref:Iron only nitrogenase protein AnfO (AnfO_nitrog) n=2 Tax=[Clostridium] fimetarium TaxID=99656 RepID=A0A1I0R9S4_9FIRM|nr:Iron only nitrogenase protein AnfO (AnfO_nitrog) [[Clostridium] fimetarium]